MDANPTDFYGIPVTYAGCGPEWLYMLYGDNGALYVGITKRGRQRFVEHRNQRWWGEVRRISVERFATRAEACDAERRTIGATATPYNYADRGMRDEIRTLRGRVAALETENQRLRTALIECAPAPSL